MAISINWGTKVVYIPKADLTLIQATPTEIRSMDLNWFRLKLKDLEDNPDGMPFPKTHNHNTEVSVGGLTLARVIEVLEPYTITFEDGQYAVNLYGANSNVADRCNVNQVSIRSANSAGLITVVSGSGVTEQDKLDIADRVWDEDITDHSEADSTGDTLAGAGSAGDPWEIVLPGMYGNNTAGKIIGTNLNAKVGDVKDKTDLIPADPATNAQVNTRMESFTYIAPDNAGITSIKNKTDLIPADPATNTQVNTRLAASAYVAPDNASITSIKNKTDALPTDPASNTQVNTRMGTFTYVAPDNTGISNIKTQTDKLHFSGDNVQAKVSDKGDLNDPSVTDIDTQLSLVHGAGGWGGDNGLTIEDIVAGVVDGLEPLQGDVTAIKTSVTTIEHIETGKWDIVNGVMTLYAANGTTPIVQFRLYDKDNVLVTTATQIPMKRVPI